jgi:lipopolysaccharide transport system permease protein
MAHDTNQSTALTSDGLIERVITPHDGLDAFRDAYRSLVNDWPTTRSLAWRMFVRDTKATYRQSFLGYIWLLLPALANTLVWVFLQGTSVVSIEAGSVPYPLFVFVGNVLWTAFNGSLVNAMGVIEEAKGTLAKVNFPHEALILSGFGKSLLNTLATAVFIVPFLLIYPIDLQPSALLFPIGVFATLICGTALGLIVVPCTALFSDLGRAIHLGLRVAFFLTPVIFTVPPSGWAYRLMIINPATSLFVTSRSWLIGGEVPMYAVFGVVTLCSILLLIVGVITLKVSLPHIIERLSG